MTVRIKEECLGYMLSLQLECLPIKSRLPATFFLCWHRNNRSIDSAFDGRSNTGLEKLKKMTKRIKLSTEEN
ncbi:hypothetical protein ACTXT7_011728 [Hymenolepis weldensis]